MRDVRLWAASEQLGGGTASDRTDWQYRLDGWDMPVTSPSADIALEPYDVAVDVAARPG